MNYRVLILSPITSNKIEALGFKKYLDFLSDDVDIVDPLCGFSDEDYSIKWESRLRAIVGSYDVLVGFSYGGCLLYDFLRDNHLLSGGKKIILISCPLNPSKALKSKLSQLVRRFHISEDKGMECLDKYIYSFPKQREIYSKDVLVSERYIFGFTRLLNRSSYIHDFSFDFLNIIGEESKLVKKEDTFKYNLHLIKNSGMRVFEENNVDVQNAILNYIKKL